MSLFYHGKDKKQCYYEPLCLVCFIKVIIAIIKLKGERPCVNI